MERLQEATFDTLLGSAHVRVCRDGNELVDDRPGFTVVYRNGVYLGLVLLNEFGEPSVQECDWWPWLPVRCFGNDLDVGVYEVFNMAHIVKPVVEFELEDE